MQTANQYPTNQSTAAQFIARYHIFDIDDFLNMEWEMKKYFLRILYTDGHFETADKINAMLTAWDKGDNELFFNLRQEIKF